LIALIDEDVFLVSKVFWNSDKGEALEEFYTMPLEDDEVVFIYLGYSGILLRTAQTTVAFDIADLLGDKEIKAMEGLDLLLFTHGHGDHYKTDTTLQVFEAKVPHIVAESSVAKDLKGKIPEEELTMTEKGETYTIGDFTITAIEGIHRGPIILYLLEMDDKRVFHGGDSGYVSLEKYKANLAFLPIGKPSPTASPEDALQMTRDLRPRTAVTVHGSDQQNMEFKRILEEAMPESILITPEEFIPDKIELA
jgi:L-ascorbate metabolism protein UlaG (beta-lactamase superfamily)